MKFLKNEVGFLSFQTFSGEKFRFIEPNAHYPVLCSMSSLSNVLPEANCFKSHPKCLLQANRSIQY